MGEVSVGDVLEAMADLCHYLRPALDHDRKPELDLLAGVITVLMRNLTNPEKARMVTLGRGKSGAIGITLGCGPGA